eukprot:711892-Prymnesium_polylepis.1
MPRSSTSPDLRFAQMCALTACKGAKCLAAGAGLVRSFVFAIALCSFLENGSRQKRDAGQALRVWAVAWCSGGPVVQRTLRDSPGRKPLGGPPSDVFRNALINYRSAEKRNPNVTLASLNRSK